MNWFHVAEALGRIEARLSVMQDTLRQHEPAKPSKANDIVQIFTGIAILVVVATGGKVPAELLPWLFGAR